MFLLCLELKALLDSVSHNLQHICLAKKVAAQDTSSDRVNNTGHVFLRARETRDVFQMYSFIAGQLMGGLIDLIPFSMHFWILKRKLSLIFARLCEFLACWRVMPLKFFFLKCSSGKAVNAPGCCCSFFCSFPCCFKPVIYRGYSFQQCIK